MVSTNQRGETRFGSTNERGETRLANERLEGRLANERGENRLGERGETRLANERGETRLTNERRRHRTSSTSRTTTISTEEAKAKLPKLEEKVVWPVQELVAILGGVLGFWGGVGSMGALFLLVLMTQRFFCRRREDKKEGW